MDTENPNGSSDYATPDRDVEIDQIRTGTETAYAGAYRIAVETLAATGLSGPGSGAFGMDHDQAHRLVSHVLGAALIELEAPWRDALENAHAAQHGYRRALELVERENHEIRRRLESSEAAYRHVSTIEAEQRERADTAEHHLDRARDLAVRLEGELSLVTELAGSVDREWLRRWAEAPDSDDPNPYADRMRAAARIVLEETNR